MTKQLKDLELGALVMYPDAKYYNEPIVWKLCGHDHPGYPTGSTIVITDNIICFKCFDAAERKNPISRNVRRYGNNDYDTSNIREWLNTYKPKWKNHIYDAPPSDDNVRFNPYYDEPGFLTNFSDVFINALIPLDNGDYFTLPTLDNMGFECGGIVSAERFPIFDKSESRICCATKGAIYHNDFTTSYFNYWLKDALYGSSRYVHIVSHYGHLFHSWAYDSNIGVRVVCNLKSDTLVTDQPNENGVYEIILDRDDQSINHIENSKTENPICENVYTEEELDMVLDLITWLQVPSLEDGYSQNVCNLWLKVNHKLNLVKYRT